MSKVSVLGGKVYEHESYGMVGLQRVGCGGHIGEKQLFMSDVSVGSYIRLTIRQGAVERGLHTDWPSGSETLISVDLSPTQFAEMLTNMNVGDGVPCTINFKQGRGFIDYEPLPSKIDLIREEQEQEIVEADTSIKKAIALLEEAKAGKGYLNKTQITELLDALSGARYIYSNNDFAKKSAQAEIDKMVVQAKAQVSAFVDHKIYSTGIAALKEGFSEPQLIEGGKKDGDEA